MCYDGALVMPSKFVMMDEDEMTYVEGGTWNNFKQNMLGLIDYSAPVRWAFGQLGITPAYVAALGYMSYTFATATFGSAMVSVATAVGGVVGAILGIAGVSYAMNKMWNDRIFY